MRRKYDALIFGDSAQNKEFKNEEAYQYWSSKSDKKNDQTLKEDYQQMQDRVRETLSKYSDYGDFLKNFEEHRDTHEARSHLMREEGWKNLNEKYGPDYKHWEDVEGENAHKYNKYRERYMESYWDTKENHLYYS